MNILKVLYILAAFAAMVSSVYADSDLIEFRRTADSELYNMIKGNNPEGVKKALNNGADVNAQDKYRMTTPLIEASKRGYLEIVKILVKNRAELNKTVTLGVNALVIAAGNGHLEVVKFLIENGADVNLSKGYKETALMHSSLGGHTDVVKFLLEKGADPNMQNVEGVTALMFAVQFRKNFKIVKLLIENGADPNIKNKRGTALSWASGKKRDSGLSHKQRGTKVGIAL